MAVSLVKNSSLKLIETSSSGAINANDATMTFELTDTSTRNATTTPDAEDGAYVLVTLTAGAATVDFTAVVHQILSASATLTKNANGKSIRDIKFKNNSANPIRIKNGASNGFLPAGSVFDFTLPAGGSAFFDFAALAAAISGTNKTLDISGTGTDTLQILLGWG